MINLIYMILPTICLIVGFYIGFTVRKEDKLPQIKNPIEVIKEDIKEKKQQKQEEREMKVFDTYMENIDNYPLNQKDIKE